MNLFLELKNASSAPLAELPCHPFSEFRDLLLCHVNNGYRVVSFFAVPGKTSEKFLLVAVLADQEKSTLHLASALVGNRFESLTKDCPQFHWFEREIAEQYGILPDGHPWLKPIRFHRPLGGVSDAWNRKCGEDILPGVPDGFCMEGDAVHEVAVGPVHAGVIEPGHFRFQCMGEDVFFLEISLGYQYRGIEKALIGGPSKRTLHYMETASGDSSIASATAYCSILEALDTKAAVTERTHLLRAVALELERMANHIGDLGALSGDVAYLPSASYCGRIRGEYLNMTALLCGNRFGRGFVVPGSSAFDLDSVRVSELLKRMDKFYPELDNALDLMFDEPSVLDRFESTGTVDLKTAREIGMVGVPARASGISMDVRRFFPWGAYKRHSSNIALGKSGDAFARALVRQKELGNSDRLIRDMLDFLSRLEPENTDVPVRTPACAPDSIAVSLVEAWRGEMCHTAVTGPDGRFLRYKIVDPSFHNWFGLALALRGEQISNFPICNKSFNLSYCGHDL